jgi:hypothetical protein
MFNRICKIEVFPQILSRRPDKRVGRLTPTDNHTAISGPIFFMYGLKFAETLQFYKSG